MFSTRKSILGKKEKKTLLKEEGNIIIYQSAICAMYILFKSRRRLSVAISIRSTNALRLMKMKFFDVSSADLGGPFGPRTTTQLEE